MSPMVQFAVDVAQMAVVSALVWGYTQPQHPPFWRMCLVTAPASFAVITTMAIVGAAVML